MLKKVMLLTGLLILAACTTPAYQGITVTSPSAGSTSPGLAEQLATGTIRSFEVSAQQIPAFLGPIIVSNFSVALAERGLQPVSSDGDLVVSLRYEQSDIESEVLHDSFDEQLAEGGETRFNARIVAEFRQRDSSRLLWQGHIQRLHTVSPGEYMHTGRASVALLSAFRDLLQDIPEVTP